MSDLKYSNLIGIESSLYDIILKFGIRDIKQAQANEHDEVANIVLTWQHAKAFLGLLQDQVKDYELQFGPINLNILEVINKEEQG